MTALKLAHDRTTKGAAWSMPDDIKRNQKADTKNDDAIIERTQNQILNDYTNDEVPHG